MARQTALLLPLVAPSPYQLINIIFFYMISGLVFQYGRTDCASAPYGGSQSLPINMIFLNMISGLVFQYGRMDCASAPYGGTQSLTINIIFLFFLYLS